MYKSNVPKHASAASAASVYSLLLILLAGSTSATAGLSITRKPAAEEPINNHPTVNVTEAPEPPGLITTKDNGVTVSPASGDPTQTNSSTNILTSAAPADVDVAKDRDGTSALIERRQPDWEAPVFDESSKKTDIANAPAADSDLNGAPGTTATADANADIAGTTPAEPDISIDAETDLDAAAVSVAGENEDSLVEPAATEAAEPEQPLLLLAAPTMRSMIAEPEESLFSTKWRSVHGGERTDFVNRVVTRMHDFTTIAAGQTKSFSSGRNDAWIVAVDADGERAWEQIIGGARDDEALDLALVDDGDVIVVGSTESLAMDSISGPVGFIARIDADGKLLWKQHLDQKNPHRVTATTLLSSGEGAAFGSDSGVVRMYKFALDGSRITEVPVTECRLDSINAAVTNAKGDVIIGGQHSDFLDLVGSLCRISPDGSVSWQVYAGTNSRSEIKDLAAVGEDTIAVGFHLAESGDDQALAVRVDAAGEKVWEKSLGTHTSERLEALSVLSDNRILVVGTILDQDAISSRHWIVALSESGEVMESEVGDARDALALMDLAPRPDGRYVVVGRQTDEINREVNGYIALMGVQNLSAGQSIKVSEAAVAPTVIIPGDGSIVSEKPATEILGNVIHNRPIARVFVNGQATRLMQNGAFRTFVSTPMGRTTITVAAIDDQGHVGEAKVDVIRRESVRQEGADLDQILADTNFGSYHAILIGNQAYANGIDTLDTPYKDVDVLSQILTEQYGFSVNVLKDATRKDILEALDTASQSLGQSDNLMIYYAGHGHYDKDYDQGYWLPVDATSEDRTTWIESGAVKEVIKRMNAKHVLLVADSCFSGTLLRSVDNQRSSKFYEIIASRTARLAMTSGNIEPVMDGGGDGHSVFARHFITTLQTDKPIIDGTYLYNSVREPVVTQSGQMPQYSNIRFLESDGGDFLFVKRR